MLSNVCCLSGGSCQPAKRVRFIDTYHALTPDSGVPLATSCGQCYSVKTVVIVLQCRLSQWPMLSVNLPSGNRVMSNLTGSFGVSQLASAPP